MMMSKIRDSDLLPELCTVEILRNSLTNKQANPQQREDLLNFRQVGLSEFHTYITYTYLKPSSVPLTQKRKTVHTFSDHKISKKSPTQKENERLYPCASKDD